jgi:light-regulated signal transduction histidine kinase (bacteriophytochrome)
MKYGDQLDEKAHKYMGHMIDGVERMQALINDLLVYSRVGTRGKEFRPADLNEVLAAALQNLEHSIRESGVVITHDELPTLTVDAMQIRQLFQNLVGNAVKFRGECEVRIHISAEQRDGEWLFGVRDNGVGIDPKYSERIFEIFQRLHGRAGYSGTGIGLSICRRIVERHGGWIWVESKPGEGSTFLFTIPNERGGSDE